MTLAVRRRRHLVEIDEGEHSVQGEAVAQRPQNDNGRAVHQPFGSTQIVRELDDIQPACARFCSANSANRLELGIYAPYA